MRRLVHPSSFAHLVVNQGSPPHQARLDPPRRARVTARLYDGTTATLELDVVSRAKGYVCVRQEREGAAPWLAWLPAGAARPVGL